MQPTAHPDPALTEVFRQIRADARAPGSSDHPVAVMAAVEAVLDGGVSPLTTGIQGGLILPFSGRIRKVELQEFKGTSGTITLDIKAGVPGATPTFASICGTALPTISTSGRYYMDQSYPPTNGLAGWTTRLDKGTALQYVINAVTGFTQLVVVLHVQRMDITG